MCTILKTRSDPSMRNSRPSECQYRSRGSPQMQEKGTLGHQGGTTGLHNDYRSRCRISWNTETRNAIRSSYVTPGRNQTQHTTGTPADWWLAQYESPSPGYRASLSAVNSWTDRGNGMHIYMNIYAPTIRVWLCHSPEQGHAVRRKSGWKGRRLC